MARFNKELQETILKKRGLKRSKGPRERGAKSRIIKDAVDIDRSDRTKTLAMKLLEERFGTSIDILLLYGTSDRQVARRLGIHESTVSLWRLKLGLRDKGIVLLEQEQPQLQSGPAS